MSSATCFLAGNLQTDAAPWVCREHTVACRAKGDVTLGHAALSQCGPLPFTAIPLSRNCMPTLEWTQVKVLYIPSATCFQFGIYCGIAAVQWLNRSLGACQEKYRSKFRQYFGSPKFRQGGNWHSTQSFSHTLTPELPNRLDPHSCIYWLQYMTNFGASGARSKKILSMMEIPL